ncbi:unnamed protein product [Cylindrotheca closterium]|uniref:Uncharacterized protein n=1 Tax=Cylindrotheca closterium TaxID=2856 RepID=A0AAD2G1Y5_9STRA|nr:unnamed protein product [Cylindrotheca closterium]
MVWGSAGGFKSCDSLLQRVRDNDSKLTSVVILPMKTFGATEVTTLAQILESGLNTNLKSISASGHKVPPEALETLGKALATTGGQYVKQLSIGDESMGDEGVVALLQPLLETCHLEHVDFGFKSLSPTGTAMIGKALGASGLKKLEIYRNPTIGDDGMLALVSNAKDAVDSKQDDDDDDDDDAPQFIFSSLEFLDISECAVGPKGMEALTKRLLSSSEEEATTTTTTTTTTKPTQQRPKAMELIASLNPLTSKSGALLGTLISTNTLCKLSVKKCQLGDDGILALMEAASSSLSAVVLLSSLDLSQNGLTTVGASGMASILLKAKQQQQFSSLTELNLSGNRDVGPQGVVELAKAFSSPDNNVCTLDMGSTSCGIEGAAALLQNCPSLKSLRLFDNNLQCEGLESIAPHLQGGHLTLEHLDLGGNRAKAPAVATLLSSILKENPDPNFLSVLNTVELGGNQGSDEVEEIITSMSKSRPEIDVARDKPKAQQNDEQEGEGNLFQNPNTSWVQH